MVINMSEYNNVPKIRFKGFTDVWEQRKLEEISNRFDNLRVPVSANEREKGTTPYYGANGIQDYVKGFTHNGEYVLIAEDGANDLKNYPVKYVNGLFWANNHVHVVQGKEGICDNKYLKYCFTKTNIESLLVGGGRAKLNANIMMSIDLTVPSFNEQVELGRMFYELDNLITLHQRKCDNLINVKKSLLEKMFPKNSSNIPEIRFKGFTDAWEQRKLGDVSFFKQGSQVDLDKQYSDLNENRVRFIRIVDYTQNTDDIRYIDKELSNNIINEKDVVIVRYGATAGFVGHGITGVLANNMFTVNPENAVAKDYLYIYLKQDKIYKKLNNSNGSSAMPALNFGTVKDVEIAYPLVAEQDKIGELFTNLDNLITLHQRKLEKLKNIKKSMLDKMFV